MSDRRRYPAEQQGQRGRQGEPGRQGPAGIPGPAMPRNTRRALAALFLLVFAVGGADLFWSSHLATQQTRLTEKTAQLSEKATQLGEQNARTLRKLNEQAAANARIRCTALRAEIAVPIGMPIKGHESRIYDSRQRAIDISRAQHLGCNLHLKGDR